MIGIKLTLSPLLKKTFNLTINATNEYLYGLRERGICSIPLIADDSDIACIDRAFKLLSSRDLIVPDIAWDEWSKIAQRPL